MLRAKAGFSTLSVIFSSIFFGLIELELATAGKAYYGKLIGPLSSYEHGLGGTVYAVDSRTLHIRDFKYDGEGPAGYFYVSRSKNPGENGIKIPDERGSLEPLKRYKKRHITLTLPEGHSLQDINIFYVWCDDYSVNFGDVKIPRNFDYPKPQKIGKLSGVHGVSSDNVVIVDSQTLLLPNFSYDGEAPDAKFWTGPGRNPTAQGILVPDENGKETPLRRYDRKTLVLTLPGDLTVSDIGHFGVWCEAFTVDFGHVQIPSVLNTPPSLRMLGVSPQKRRRSVATTYAGHFNAERIRDKNADMDFVDRKFLANNVEQLGREFNELSRVNPKNPIYVLLSPTTYKPLAEIQKYHRKLALKNNNKKVELVQNQKLPETVINVDNRNSDSDKRRVVQVDTQASEGFYYTIKDDENANENASSGNDEFDSSTKADSEKYQNQEESLSIIQMSPERYQNQKESLSKSQMNSETYPNQKDSFTNIHINAEGHQNQESLSNVQINPVLYHDQKESFSDIRINPETYQKESLKNTRINSDRYQSQTESLHNPEIYPGQYQNQKEIYSNIRINFDNYPSRREFRLTPRINPDNSHIQQESHSAPQNKPQRYDTELLSSIQINPDSHQNQQEFTSNSGIASDRY